MQEKMVVLLAVVVVYHRAVNDQVQNLRTVKNCRCFIVLSTFMLFWLHSKVNYTIQLVLVTILNYDSYSEI